MPLFIQQCWPSLGPRRRLSRGFPTKPRSADQPADGATGAGFAASRNPDAILTQSWSVPVCGARAGPLASRRRLV